MPFSFCRICPSMCGRRSRALLSGGSACCSYFRRRQSIDRCQSVNCQSSGCGQLRSTVHCLESVRMVRLWRPRSYDVVICLSFYWLFLWHVIVTCTSHELGCCRRVISCISCGRVVKLTCYSNVRLLCVRVDELFVCWTLNWACLYIYKNLHELEVCDNRVHLLLSLRPRQSDWSCVCVDVSEQNCLRLRRRATWCDIEASA